MPRTIISLDPEDHAWLTGKARAMRTPMTELVRRAVKQFRVQSGPHASPLDRLLEDTAGLWMKGDALAYQRRMRRDWDKR